MFFSKDTNSSKKQRSKLSNDLYLYPQNNNNNKVTFKNNDIF